MIPNNFLRKHGVQLSTVATLTVPGGTIWHLGMKKVGNCICFVDGWQDFIQHYSIGIGYLLVFTYQGNSNFIVHIFGTAELDYQSASISRTKEPFHEDYHHIFEDVEDINSFDFMDSAPLNPTGALQGMDFTGCTDQLIPAENCIQQRHENKNTKKISRKKRKSRKSELSDNGERVNAHIPKRGRGRRSNRNDGERSTQPTQSQVEDPTQYMNYQDELHDAIDGGYDSQQFLDLVEGGDVQQGEDVVPRPDVDDIAAQEAPKQLPEVPPFPGGPTDISVLSSYASHVALPLWFNANNVCFIFICLRLLSASFLYAILK